MELQFIQQEILEFMAYKEWAVKPYQLQKFHAILAKKQLMQNKEDLVFGISNGRTSSSSALTYNEMNRLIDHLNGNVDKDKADVMRKKILYYAHLMDWHTEDKKIDWKRLNEWCKKYGHAHKYLNDYKLDELPLLVSQYEEVYRNFASKI